MLVSDGGAEIRKRLSLFFHRSSETIKTAEAFQLLRVIEACSIERPAQDSNGFVIRFERYRGNGITGISSELPVSFLTGSIRTLVPKFYRSFEMLADLR